MSLVGVYNAEWRKRKINLFSIVRSFVSQLSPNQEITKISLPSELCHPFSMLELVSYRQLQLFHMLFDINQDTDPFLRFQCVVKWYLGLVREETIEKKPFNPVIEESHLAWIQHDGGHYSEFIGEQVSHHPPVSAFVVRNRSEGIEMNGAVTFRVGFGSNCASVSTGGNVRIRTREEEYVLSKCVPDMMVNNVIWGDKYLMWNGGVNISCSSNRYVAKLEFAEEDERNVIYGEIFDGEKLLFRLSGIAGKETYYEDVGSESGERKLFVNIGLYKENIIQYLPEEVQDPFESMKLWMPVKLAIIKNDMALADEEKKKIEADQRLRQKFRFSNGSWKETRYFKFCAPEGHDLELPEEEIIAKGSWEFKNNFTIDEQFLSSAYAEAEKIREQNGLDTTWSLLHQDPQPSDTGESSTCSIQ